MAKATKALAKITPFKFPHARHTRKNHPQRYKSYSSYKPNLRKEFEERCVYCRTPLSPGWGTHAVVEHFRPQVKFPELATDYLNLFLSCDICNSYKGSHWSEESVKTLLNPCDDVMSHHVSYSSTRVESSSARGEHHIQRLRINRDDRVHQRKLIIQASIGGIETLQNYKSQNKANDEYPPEIEELVEAVCALLSSSPDQLRKAIGL